MATILTFFSSLKSKGHSKDTIRKKFINDLIAAPHHSWIQNDPIICKAFYHFFGSLPLNKITLLEQKNVHFLLCNSHMSCAITAPANASVILIFPGLYRILNAGDPSQAFAILAHELGHIVGSHSNRNISILSAQKEADAFACSLGFSEELKSLLLLEDSDESQLRLDSIADYGPHGES